MERQKPIAGLLHGALGPDASLIVVLHIGQCYRTDMGVDIKVTTTFII